MKTIVLVTFFLLSFFIVTVLSHFLYINFIVSSVIGNFFYDNLIFSLFFIFILFYFIFVGIYYFKINIDPYVVQVSSFRPIFHFFSSKDYVDVPHSMLSSYSFFNRPLSFNKTLVLKIISNTNKKIIIKRFNFSFISEKKILKISSVLDSIILNND